MVNELLEIVVLSSIGIYISTGILGMSAVFISICAKKIIDIFKEVKQ